MRKRTPLGPDYHAEPGETKGHQHDVYTTKGELHGYTRIHVGTLMKNAVEDLAKALAQGEEADARLADAMDGAMADALTIEAARWRIADLEHALTEIRGLPSEMKCDKYKIDRAQLVASNALRGITRAPRPPR